MKTKHSVHIMVFGVVTNDDEVIPQFVFPHGPRLSDIYQPLHSGRIWHKVNFKRSLTGLNSKFSFS